MPSSYTSPHLWLIHGHSLCVYSIRYQFSRVMGGGGKQQDPSVQPAPFPICSASNLLAPLRIKLFVCSLSVGHSIALSIAVSVSGNCVVFISLQYVCACPLHSVLSPLVHTPQLSYCRLFFISLLLLLLLSMTPCHAMSNSPGTVPSTSTFLSRLVRLFAQWVRTLSERG